MRTLISYQGSLFHLLHLFHNDAALPFLFLYFGNLLARRHADEGNVARAQLTLVECLEETDVPAWMRAATKAHLLRLRGHAGS